MNDMAVVKQSRPENNPLTLEELREKVWNPYESGTHIWVKVLMTGEVIAAITDIYDGMGVVAVWSASNNLCDLYAERDYSKTWLAYRYKPKEETR